MHLSPLRRVFTYLAIGSCLALAQSNPQSSEPDGNRWLQSLLKMPVPKIMTFVPDRQPAPSNCRIEPLASIDDPSAALLEASAGTIAVVDTTGLTEATASSLAHLQDLVTSVGGRMDLKSAYRPPAYQEHLQAVWDKWRVLHRNRQPGCADLRAQIEEEFKKHDLLATQRPVSASDHTRGMAIDAALFLPPGARLERRRVSLDRLAKMVGFKRPDIRHDPVHYRLLAPPPFTAATHSAP